MRVRFVFITNHILDLGSGRKGVLCVISKGLNDFPFSSSLFRPKLCGHIAVTYSLEIRRTAVMYGMEVLRSNLNEVPLGNCQEIP